MDIIYTPRLFIRVLLIYVHISDCLLYSKNKLLLLIIITANIFIPEEKVKNGR